MALAIDSSASMFLKLPDVRKAVAALLDTGLTNRDRAMLIDFDTDPRLVRPVTRDLGAVTAALVALTPDGGTALWEAISYSLRSSGGSPAARPWSSTRTASTKGSAPPIADCLCAPPARAASPSI